MSDITRQPMGWEHTLGIAVETVWGTYVAPTQWLPATSKIVKNPGHTPVRLAVGSRHRRHVTSRGIRVAGSLTLPLCPGRCDEFAAMFELVAGDDVHLKSHSILEQHNDEWAKKIIGAYVNGARIRCEVSGEEGGGDLIAELDMVARDSSDAVAPGTPNYLAQPVAFTFHELVLEKDSVAITSKRSIEIAVAHNLHLDKWGGSDRLLRDVPIGPCDIDINLGIDWEEIAWYDLYLAGTEFELTATFTRVANTLTFTFPRSKIINGADPEQQEQESKDQITPAIIALESDDGTAPMIIAAA